MIKLNNKVYDVLKWICIIVAPAFCTLIKILANAWGWEIPVEAIVTSVTAVAAFVGVILGFSNYQYKQNNEE